ncbi:unnamed protein product [Schistocephalus solidus]|uniref:Coiled-coil domain containing 87 n=1 Tax=Schistocephalus solidus TaxID=70667 RepID=A0A183T313_SCHSO|nr:unnamed protein product [Schistocephalus solidus]
MSSNHQLKASFLSSLATHFSGQQSFPPGIFTNLIRRFPLQQKALDDVRLLYQQTRVTSYKLTSPTGQKITYVSLPFSPEKSYSSSPSHARANALFGHLIRPDSFLLVLLQLNSCQVEEEFENLRRTAYSFLQALQLRAPGAMLQFLVFMPKECQMVSHAKGSGSSCGLTEADHKSFHQDVKLPVLMKKVEKAIQLAVEDFTKSLVAPLTSTRIQIISLVGLLPYPTLENVFSVYSNVSVTQNPGVSPHGLQNEKKAERNSLQNFRHGSLLREQDSLASPLPTGVFCRLETLRSFLLHCERCFCVGEAYRPGEDICPPDWELALRMNQRRHRRALFIPLEQLVIDYHSGRTGSFADLQTYLNVWTKLGRAVWLERHHFLKKYVIFRVETFCELVSLLINAEGLLACYSAHLRADPRHFSNRISALADISVEETQLCFRLIHKDGIIPSPLMRVLLGDDIIQLCTPLLQSKHRKTRTQRDRRQRRAASSMQFNDPVGEQKLSTDLRPLPNALVEKLKEMLDLGFELKAGDEAGRNFNVSFFCSATNIHLKINSMLVLTDWVDGTVKINLLSVAAPREILDIFFDRVLIELYTKLRHVTTISLDSICSLPSTETHNCLRKVELEVQNGSILIEHRFVSEMVEGSWEESILQVSVEAASNKMCFENKAEMVLLSTVENLESETTANLNKLLQKVIEDFHVEFPGCPNQATGMNDN